MFFSRFFEVCHVMIRSKINEKKVFKIAFKIYPKINHKIDAIFLWIFNGFLMDFEWILARLSRILVTFLQQHLQNANAALARNELTENVKNMRVTAEICKNLAQPKTQTSKLRSITCKLQNAISCNKRQSSKWGAAVTAPHGAFR